MNRMRQEKIKQYIQQNKLASIKELQALCPEVSLMTIHRDLDLLEKQHFIMKVRGGARSLTHTSDPGYAVREEENIQSKEAIAQKALPLIVPDSAVFFDAGTTALALARALPDISLHVFTTSPVIALELCRLSLPSINLCCGNLNRSNLALSGQSTLNMLKDINIDLAFLGVSGCSAEHGFTCGKESEMLVKRLVIQKARTSVALMDATKLTRLMPFTFAELEDFDYVVGDILPDNFIHAAKHVNTKIL